METAGKLVDDEQLKEALKEKGLGTPATRAAIIETLLERGYIAREKKALPATDLGRYLVALVQDRGLKSPELTGEWEAKLREIERGRLDPRRFMGEIARYTAEVIRIGDAAAIDPGRLGDCPRCGRPVIEGKRGFGCSGWKEGCPFVLWREYQGQPLGDDQVRELLQRRVLPRPVTVGGAGEVVLHLTDSGALTEIPVPTGGPRWPAGKARRPQAGGRKGPRKDRRGAASDPPEAAPSRERPSGFAAVALGPCPLCQSEVVEQEKSYGCSGWKAGCRFAIWKTIAGKKIGVRGPGAPPYRQEPAAQGLPVEVGPALRGPPEAGRRRGPVRFRDLSRAPMIPRTPGPAARVAPSSSPVPSPTSVILSTLDHEVLAIELRELPVVLQLELVVLQLDFVALGSLRVGLPEALQLVVGPGLIGREADAV